MRQIEVRAKGFHFRTVLRVVPAADLATQWEPGLRFLVRASTPTELSQLHAIAGAGVDNVAALTPDLSLYDDSETASVLEFGVRLEDGDVISVANSRRHAQVLYRESDLHHTVFLTNRCNSNCLMCSQPPTPQEDSWLVDEAFQIARHIRASPQLLGFTGGEPLLLGVRLRDVIDRFAEHHPNTDFDLLTNGRLLGDPSFATSLLGNMRRRVTWMVPLYGHADFLHDFVVQSPGAFEETLAGLLSLQKYQQPIQLRIVLIEPVLQLLPQLCEFIAKNLPFVRDVALMGCEPIGFALANRPLCEVDLIDWSHELEVGVRILKRGQLTPTIMNAPLCALPPSLWPFMHQSISDWKRVFAPECNGCSVKLRCSGLFASHERGWRPTIVKPLEESTL